MTPRENLISCYRRQGCETAPVTFGLCPSLRAEFQRRYGEVKPEDHFGFSSRLVLFSHPTHRVVPDWQRWYAEPLRPGTRFSYWGIAHEPGSDAAMHMTRMRHPLIQVETVAELQAYPWPDFSRVDLPNLRAQVAAIHAQGCAAHGGMEMTIWEVSWYLRSMERMMQDMVDDDSKATWLFDRTTEIACQRAQAFALADCDVIGLGDDVGTQRGLMMSPAMYRRWLKPRLAAVIQAARAVKPEILIQYHSCGQVTPLISDLIEAGIDVLNPVQPECMEFSEIFAKYGDRLSFNGTIGTQTTMPFASPDQVRDLVHRNLRLAGRRGGLVACPTHLLEPEVPWENIEAYVEACRTAW